MADHEFAFEAVVSLDQEQCTGCGGSMADATHGEPLGQTGEDQAGAPWVRFWHYDHAPAVLQAFHRASKCREKAWLN